MKKLFVMAAVAVALASCQKSKDAGQPPAPPAEPEIAKPSASFRIVNASESDILELRTLVFQNTSKNAESYSWDLGEGANFSDGVVDQPMRYSDKAEPTNIYMVPCMRTVTIRLTARNKKGEESVATQTFNVQCFRGTGGRHPEQHKLY